MTTPRVVLGAASLSLLLVLVAPLGLVLLVASTAVAARDEQTDVCDIAELLADALTE